MGLDSCSIYWYIYYKDGPYAFLYFYTLYPYYHTINYLPYIFLVNKSDMIFYFVLIYK